MAIFAQDSLAYGFAHLAAQSTVGQATRPRSGPVSTVTGYPERQSVDCRSLPVGFSQPREPGSMSPLRACYPIFNHLTNIRNLLLFEHEVYAKRSGDFRSAA